MRNFLLITAGIGLMFVSVVGCGDTAPESISANDMRPIGYAGKADCPNCDPNGPGAFEQAQISARWYAPGDEWQVAFQFRNRGVMTKTDFLRPTKSDEWTKSGVFLFGYRVTEAFDADEYTYGRKAVEVEVDQVDPAQVRIGKTSLDTLGYFETERVDRHEYKLTFRMNDLTDAIDVTYFNRSYPHGRTVRASNKYALALPSSIFPVNVPRLLVDQPWITAPVLPRDLEIIADAVDSGWRNRRFKKFEFANGDRVFWAEGDPWPFYIENGQGRGLLLRGAVN
jgi:hypothetical protein